MKTAASRGDVHVWLPVSEVARLQGVSRRRVLQWIAEGRLMAAKVSGRWIISDVWLTWFSRNPPGRPKKGR